MARRPAAIAPTPMEAPGGLTPEGSAERPDYDFRCSEHPGQPYGHGVNAGTCDAVALEAADVNGSPETVNGTAFATDYANGEAVDVPVEPAAPAELFPPLREPEMHDGREVNQHQVRFGGKALIGRVMDPDVAFWSSLRGGRRGYAKVAFQVGDDGYAQEKNRDGDVVSYTYYRKLKIDAVNIEGSGVDFDGADGDAISDLEQELEEAREEAAGYNETIIDWVTAARLVAEQFELADDELGELVRGIAAYNLPGEVVVEAASDLATSDDVEESEQPSMLDAALAEAMA